MQPMWTSPAEISAKTEAICGIRRTRIVPGYAATNLFSRRAPATGFAISTCTEPEIRFTRRIDRGRRRRLRGKAKHRLSQFVAHAGILVLATHSEDMIREMCNKAVLMEHGRVASAGSPCEVFDCYKYR
jgi:ABC-type branched-subunit amino acid transport system ATPase component